MPVGTTASIKREHEKKKRKFVSSCFAKQNAACIPAAPQHGMMTLVDHAMKIAGRLVSDIPDTDPGARMATPSRSAAALVVRRFNRRHGMKSLNRLSSEPGWQARQGRALPAR